MGVLEGRLERRTTEFTSELETIMLAQELVLEPTPGFGKYNVFLEHAVAHPAN